MATSEGQAGAARDLGGRDPGEGRARLRPVARALPRQVPQGHRLPGPRPRRAARVLRLPRRTLDAPSNHQRHRIGLRHDPPPKLASQGLRHPKDHALDGLQDGSVRGEILAPAAWLPPPRQGHRGSPVQRRHRGHQGQQSRRMNNPSYTRFDNSSGGAAHGGTVLRIGAIRGRECCRKPERGSRRRLRGENQVTQAPERKPASHPCHEYFRNPAGRCEGRTAIWPSTTGGRSTRSARCLRPSRGRPSCPSSVRDWPTSCANTTSARSIGTTA